MAKTQKLYVRVKLRTEDSSIGQKKKELATLLARLIARQLRKK